VARKSRANNLAQVRREEEFPKVGVRNEDDLRIV
jgi:hypothetical protein